MVDTPPPFVIVQFKTNGPISGERFDPSTAKAHAARVGFQRRSALKALKQRGSLARGQLQCECGGSQSCNYCRAQMARYQDRQLEFLDRRDPFGSSVGHDASPMCHAALEYGQSKLGSRIPTARAIDKLT